MRVLHVIGGDLKYGASKGAFILHDALLKLGVESHILNDTPLKDEDTRKNITYINTSVNKVFLNKIFVNSEKIIKSIFLHSPRETFTLGLFGFDITKTNEYKQADIIHLHWLNQGFIRLSALSKIDKPIVWTLRDMWAFTGGSHYTMDFENYEKSRLSQFIRNHKKKIYNKNFHFVTISEWLSNKARKSDCLNHFQIKTMYNNFDLESFNPVSKEIGKSNLNLKTDKQIILYGANNPQSKRKGWDLFVNALRKLDKKKYFLLIFGNFWSYKTLEAIDIEYKSIGFVNDKRILNSIYSCADVFVASSIQDGWPKTFAEAMYCNTPVVCFKNTSISEIVDHKINGYIAEDFDADKLKEGIEWILENAKENYFKKNITKNKIMNYSSANIAKNYIKLYKEILYKK